MITYQEMVIDESRLQPVREALYHSNGPGYYIFRRFLSPEFTRHIVAFWSTLAPHHTHKPFRGKKGFTRTCPNFFSSDQNGNATFYNFFWNEPADEATYAVAHQIQILRNRVEARAPFHEILPFNGRCASFWVTISKNGDKIVPPHRDWVDENFDPRRLQATLFLSKKGVDYTGRGFVFQTNQGKQVMFGDDVMVEPGDLALWRYNNEHSVMEVSSGPGQCGFIRILFPPEPIYPEAFSIPRVFDQCRYRLRQNRLAMKYLLPLYVNIRGRS